jgi:hypothetical protein
VGRGEGPKGWGWGKGRGVLQGGFVDQGRCVRMRGGKHQMHHLGRRA